MGTVMAGRSYVVERVAHLIVRGIGLSDDPRTVASWARAMFTSETQLREGCRLANVKARDALGLVRVLRARRVILETGCRWQDAIDAKEERTLSRLLARGGIASGVVPTIEQCFRSQAFVRQPALLSRILQLLEEAGAP
jgi:hypothetical protein